MKSIVDHELLKAVLFPLSLAHVSYVKPSLHQFFIVGCPNTYIGNGWVRIG
jgi:hypothetical protein